MMVARQSRILQWVYRPSSTSLEYQPRTTGDPQWALHLTPNTLALLNTQILPGTQSRAVSLVDRTDVNLGSVARHPGSPRCRKCDPFAELCVLAARHE